MAKAKRRPVRREKIAPASRSRARVSNYTGVWRVANFPNEFRVVEWNPPGFPGFVRIGIGYDQYVADLHSRAAYRVTG